MGTEKANGSQCIRKKISRNIDLHRRSQQAEHSPLRTSSASDRQLLEENLPFGGQAADLLRGDRNGVGGVFTLGKVSMRK